MAEERENRIAQAIRATAERPTATAARMHGIPRSTLRGRQDGATTNREAKIPTQRLSPIQEEDLVNWILDEEAVGRAPTLLRIRRFAEQICKFSGDDDPLSRGWVYRFISRHECIKTKLARSLETKRAKGTTKEELDVFYNRLGTQITEKDVHPADILNVDETGVAEGETEAGRVVGTALTRFSYVAENDSRTWVSILEAASATGRRLRPVVVFTGKTLQGQWFERDKIPDWGFDCSPTGWSNSRIFENWFIDVFLPETDPGEGRWRILILDGHSSHVTIPFMFLAWLNKVQLIYLPPHTSHLTQPLDVGVFAALKKYFHQETDKFADLEARSPIQKQHFIEAYKIASDKAFTSNNIRGGFHGAGITPCDAQKAISKVVAEERLHPKSAAPKTPPKKNQLSDDIWSTPKNSKDVSRLLKRARSEKDYNDRASRFADRKIRKLTDRLLSENILLMKQNERLKLEIASKKKTGRKTVEKDPNERFARIEAIAYACAEADDAADNYETRHAANIVQEAMEIADYDEDEMENSFQLS
jgi:4-hydroxybenzoate polyprenyltransferase